MSEMVAKIARLKVAAGSLIGGVAVAAVLVATSAALAQDHGGNGGPPGHEMHGMHFKMMCGNRDAHRAAMLAFAQVKLGITDAQKSAWSSFSDKLKAADQPMRTVCEQLAGAPEPSTLPERLARMEQVSTARLNELKQVRPAIEDLYKQLTPDQQKIADRMLQHGGDRHGMH